MTRAVPAATPPRFLPCLVTVWTVLSPFSSSDGWPASPPTSTPGNDATSCSAGCACSAFWRFGFFAGFAAFFGAGFFAAGFFAGFAAGFFAAALAGFAAFAGFAADFAILPAPGEPVPDAVAAGEFAGREWVMLRLSS